MFNYIVTEYFFTEDYIKKNVAELKWLKENYNNVKNYFNNELYFKNFIYDNLLKNPEIEILDVLYDNNFNFSGTNFFEDICCRRKSHQFEIFKWVIDNKLIKEKYLKNISICNSLLREADNLSFMKFVYAFENGFNFELEEIIVFDIYIIEEIYQYMSNNGYNLKYTIGRSLTCKDVIFLRSYLNWLEFHNMKDSNVIMLTEEIGVKFGIEGLEIIKEKGFLIPRKINMNKMKNETKNWLIENEFRS